MIIQPNLLKAHTLAVRSSVFLCGPGYTSGNIVIRDKAKAALEAVNKVEAVYGEEIESKYQFKKSGDDLQTLEARFAHNVDFTLLILESPGAIAELGTFSQIPAIRDRLVVLISERYYKAESYIARGPLSLLAKYNPNSVIYFDTNKIDDMISRVKYPLTFYKYAHYLEGHRYIKKSRNAAGHKGNEYSDYIRPLRDKYEMAIALVSIIVGERASYADLLLYSGLAPKQLNAALHRLFVANKIEKVGSGRYQSIYEYNDDLLDAFNSTAISKLRSKRIAA